MTHHRTCNPAKVASGEPGEDGGVDSGKQQAGSGNSAGTVIRAGRRQFGGQKVVRATSAASVGEAILDAAGRLL